MTWTEIGSIQSESSKNTRYAISVNAEGDLGCKCHSWTHSKLAPKTCKHVESPEAGRLLEAYQRRFKPALFKATDKFLVKSVWSGFPINDYLQAFQPADIAKLDRVVNAARAELRSGSFVDRSALRVALAAIGL